MSGEISIFDDIRHDDTSREFLERKGATEDSGVFKLGKFPEHH